MIARRGRWGYLARNLRRKTPDRLGDDFQRPRYGIECPPISLEPLEGKSSHKFASELPIFPNIE
jgi:hypothetical protein